MEEITIINAVTEPSKTLSKKKVARLSAQGDMELRGVLPGTDSSSAATKGQVDEAKKAFPVGAIFISADQVDPREKLGYGVWQQYAQGRVLIGVDPNNKEFFTSGIQGKIWGRSGNGSGGVQSVTGLDTDNTDPLNPIVEIAVDGVTITGLGTAGSPLVAAVPTPIAYSRIIGYTGPVATPAPIGEQAAWNFEIPAGTLSEGDMVEVRIAGRRTFAFGGGGGTCTWSVRLHSATGIGGTRYAVYGSPGTLTYMGSPSILFTTATSQVGSAPINGATYAAGGPDVGTGTLDVAASVWVNVTAEKNVGGDIWELKYATVFLHKYIAP